MSAGHELIDLEAPLDGDFQAVVRLIIGGIAERVDFAFEEIDDLQLAVERLLAEAGTWAPCAWRSRSARSIRTRVGPLGGRGRRGAPRRRRRARPLTLRASSRPSWTPSRSRPGRRRHRRAAREAQGPRREHAHRRASLREKAREDDRELLSRYHHDGDTTAREELIERHLPLVRSLARRYAGRGEALEDIEQVGAIGLIKAIDRFELEREVSLATYATPNVVGEIKRHFRDKGWAIRVPRALQELNASMSGAIERLTGSWPLAEHRRDRRRAEDDPGGGARGHGGRVRLLDRVAVDRPGGEEELDPLETIGGEDEGFERSEDRAALEPALERLAARARDPAHALRGGTAADPDRQRVGLSQMHVSRLIRKSLSDMREELLRMPPGAAGAALSAGFVFPGTLT